MKNVISGLLGLTLMIGSAGLSFAAQDKVDTKSADSTATTAPKKVKKHNKKAAKPAAPATTTPAAPPAAK